MKFSSKFLLDVKENNDIYFNLLSQEDFDFKTKKISIDVSKESDVVAVRIDTNSVLDLKIATNALIKSLEVIDKTLKV